MNLIKEGINLEELDQDKFIENLENNLVIGVCDLEGIESGDYYIGNYTLKSKARVRNIEVGAENKKVDSDVCFINTLGLISAYAVKQSYKENKDVKDITLWDVYKITDEVNIKNIFCSDDLQINNPIISDLPELLVTPFEKVMSCIKDTLSKVSIDSLLKQYNY